MKLLNALLIAGLATALLLCGIPSSPRTHARPYSDCSLTLHPEDNYNGLIAALPRTLQRRQICFAPGRFQEPLVIKGQRNLLLSAPEGRVEFIASVSAKPGGVPYGVVNFVNTAWIELRDVTIINTYEYRPGNDTSTYSEVSCGIFANDSADLTLSQVHLHTHGKQGLYLIRSSTILTNSILQSGYFELVSYSSTVRATNTRLIQNYEPPILPLKDDRHPMVWAHGANKLEFTDTEIVFNTGIGFVVSNEPPDYSAHCPSASPLDCRDGSTHVVLQGTTTMRTSDPRKFPPFWSQHHDIHSGLLLQLRGNYPASVRDYWQNPVGSKGASRTPNAICRYGEPSTPSPPGCPPPQPMP